MISSDYNIRRELVDGDIRINPEPEDQDIQPASVDLHLGSQLSIPAIPYSHEFDRDKAIDPYLPHTYPPHSLFDCDDIPLALLPRQFILGETAESIELKDDIAGRVEGKSSLGRLGLMIHSTAGFIDPGFRGKITLEIYNLNGLPIRLSAGMSICQVSFMRLATPAIRPYGHSDLKSKYQDSEGVVGSRYAE